MNDTTMVVCPHCHAVNRVPQARLREAPACGGCKQRLFEGRPLELGRNEFDRHVGRSGIPLVVDFWAPWCGPCRMMAPAFAAAAGRLEPDYRLGKVNTEDEPELAAHFGIRSIPTLVVFRDGREVARRSGAMDAAGLERWVRAGA